MPPLLFGGRRDQAQVFARDLRSGEIVYLKDGEGARYYDAARDGHLVCPLPYCAEPAFTTVAGSERRHHFRHRTKGLVTHGERVLAHFQGKLLLAKTLRERHPEASVTVNESAADGAPEPDLAVGFPDGRRLVFELQYSRLPVEAFRQRRAAFSGVSDIWLFGHLPPHFRLPRHEHDVPCVLVGALLAEAHEAGLPVYFLDPDRELVATALFATGRVYGAGGRAVEIAIEPLSSCEIDGITFLSPAAQQERAALTARRERDERAAAHAERAITTELRQPRTPRTKAPARTPAQQQPPLPRQRPTLRPSPSPRRDPTCAAAEAVWECARPIFLRRVGLPNVPAIVDYRLASDSGTGIAPGHWKARLFDRHIEGKIGHAFTLGHAAAVFADRASLEQEHGREALRYYLLYLRRSGYVHFEGFGDSLGAPITVLADLKHPPSEELERAAPGGPFNVRLIALRRRAAPQSPAASTRRIGAASVKRAPATRRRQRLRRPNGSLLAIRLT